MSSTQPAAEIATGHLNAVGMSPALTVDDLAASVDFYTKGLGFDVMDLSLIHI